MSDEPSATQHVTRANNFHPTGDNVKHLLEHLYDLPFLQQHPLAIHPIVTSVRPSIPPSQALRQLLMNAIDAIKPPTDQTMTSSGRYHKLVCLHYIEGMTIQEAAHNLGLSERQAYRDLQRGLEAVASSLTEQLTLSDDSPVYEPPMSVRAEVERLMPRVSTLDITTLVLYAERAVQRMASQRDVILDISVPRTSITVRTDEMVSQQLLVRILSRIVQMVASVNVRIMLVNHTRSVKVIIYIPDMPLNNEVIGSDALALQLFERLGWTQELCTLPSGDTALVIAVPTDLKFLLVIDDNETLAELLDRYLMNMPYRIVAATDASTGLRLAQELLPDLIMLDIMMPEIDGWELLQRFRNSEHTVDIPIIVCSVFNDPELAHSLGATLFLPKPLSRDQFIDALSHLNLNT